jgi:hypothetical protein
MALAMQSNTVTDDVMDLDIDMDFGEEGGAIEDDLQLEV